MKINKAKASELMLNSNGRIFSVRFVKKDGSIRDMTCRLGVEKYLKGGILKYDPKDYNLVIVFDLSKNDYRTISCDTLQRLAIDGNEYQIES